MEAPTGEVAHKAAIDQRVHSRCLAGEQGIHQLRRDAVLACAGFDGQRRELAGAVGMATQLSDADRTAVAFANDELLPMQTGRIEPCPPHHRGDDRVIIWPCPPHHHLHPAIIAPDRPVRAARQPPAGVLRQSCLRLPAHPTARLPRPLAGTARVFQPRRPVAGPTVGRTRQRATVDLLEARPGIFRLRGFGIAGVPCPGTQIGDLARVGQERD